MKYAAEVNAAIARWSVRYGVRIDPALVHAIIEKESGHRSLTGAESRGRKSYGPMQVLESTARSLGYNPTALLAPAVGIDAGVKYLASLLALYPGDPERAIASYNAGPSSRPFKNPSYVQVVMGYWRKFAGAAAAAAPAAVGVVVVAAAAFLALRWAGRRRARRAVA